MRDLENRFAVEFAVVIRFPEVTKVGQQVVAVLGAYLARGGAVHFLELGNCLCPFLLIKKYLTQ